MECNLYRLTLLATLHAIQLASDKRFIFNAKQTALSRQARPFDSERISAGPEHQSYVKNSLSIRTVQRTPRRLIFARLSIDTPNDMELEDPLPCPEGRATAPLSQLN